MIGAICGLLFVFLAGFGVMRLLAGAEPLNRSELFAGSWVFGAGIISLATWLFGIVVDGWVLRAAISTLAVLLCGGGLWLSRPVRPERIRWSWIDTLAAVAVVAVVSYAGFWATQLRLGWDGVMIWEAKAYLAWKNGGVLPDGYYGDGERIFSQPFYPLYWPYLQSWFYGWSGAPSQPLVSWISVGFLIVACAAFTGVVQRFGGPRRLGLAGGVLLFGVPYFFSGIWGLFSGYADFPLAVVMLVAVGFAAWWAETNSIAALRLLAAAAALLPWIKREGLFLCAGVLLVPCVLLLGRRRWGQLTLLVAPTVVVFVAWTAFLRLNHVAVDPAFVPVTWKSVAAGLERVGPVIATVGSELIDPMHWSVLWLSFPGALVVLLIMRRWSVAAVFASAIVIPLAGVAAAYMLSSWDDYLRHVELSLPRLILQLAPAALLAFLLACPWKGRTKVILDVAAR
jgi:hypothetical protein